MESDKNQSNLLAKLKMLLENKTKNVRYFSSSLNHTVSQEGEKLFYLSGNIEVYDNNDFAIMRDYLDSKITGIVSTRTNPKNNIKIYEVESNYFNCTGKSIEINLNTIESSTYNSIGGWTHNRKEPESVYDKIKKLYYELNWFIRDVNRSTVHEKRDIHPHFDKNNFLLYPNAKRIISEVEIGIGKVYQADFLIENSQGEYILVEIENPKHKLFTKNNDFTKAVNHAIKQVEDWQEWIEDNLPSMQKVFQGISSPQAIVVIGRSIELTDKQRNSIRRRNINYRGRIKLITYDDLIESAYDYIQEIINNFRMIDEDSMYN